MPAGVGGTGLPRRLWLIDPAQTLRSGGQVSRKPAAPRYASAGGGHRVQDTDIVSSGLGAPFTAASSSGVRGVARSWM